MTNLEYIQQRTSQLGPDHKAAIAVAIDRLMESAEWELWVMTPKQAIDNYRMRIRGVLKGWYFAMMNWYQRVPPLPTNAESDPYRPTRYEYLFNQNGCLESSTEALFSHLEVDGQLDLPETGLPRFYVRRVLVPGEWFGEYQQEPFPGTWKPST